MYFNIFIFFTYILVDGLTYIIVLQSFPYSFFIHYIFWVGLGLLT